MSDFWAKKVAEARTGQAAPSTPTPTPTAWWQATAVPPVAQPKETVEVPAQPPAAPGEVPFNDVPASLRKAQSAKHNDPCPVCGGAFLSPAPNMARRCAQCNHSDGHLTPTIATGVQTDGPVAPARQVPVAPYQPGMIVARG